MALYWDLSKIKDYEKECFLGEGDNRTLKPVTHSLVWATMVIGIGNWTEKDIDEVYIRVNQYERMTGPTIYVDDGNRSSSSQLNGELDEDGYITRDEIRKHIGLSTNVARVTTARWLKRLDRIHRENVLRRS